MDSLAQQLADLQPAVPEVTRIQLQQLVQECQTQFNRVSPYHDHAIAQVLASLNQNNTSEQVSAAKSWLILAFLQQHLAQMFSTAYPQGIQAEFRRQIERICQFVVTSQWQDYAPDVFYKDLALARLKLFPAGPALVDCYSGISLRQGLSLDIRQSWRFIRLLQQLGGRVGYYQTHVHLPLLPAFDHNGWKHAYQLIAQMLKQYPSIKGVFSVSWLRDPQLAEISPHLAYLNQGLIELGAQAFYCGIDTSGDALVKSRHRQQLFQQGKYQPQRVLLIWPKAALLRWAAGLTPVS